MLRYWRLKLRALLEPCAACGHRWPKEFVPRDQEPDWSKSLLQQPITVWYRCANCDQHYTKW